MTPGCRGRELSARSDALQGMLACCELCPHRCGVDRLSGETGRCRTGRDAQVASWGPHPGEEAILSGTRGSGTIFFSGCNMHCCFCQNHDISQRACGRIVSARQLADIMLELQHIGCHNINLVSPTHVVPQIVAALVLAAPELRIPLVYNSGGYDRVDVLRMLDGVVDIYMPDMKYSDAEMGARYSGVADYPDWNQKAVQEMHRQVGNLRIADGVAVQGLLVRHLVLPHDLAGTAGVLGFVARALSKNTYVNIMAKYRPAYRAHAHAELSRSINAAEFRAAVGIARRLGLTRLDR